MEAPAPERSVEWVRQEVLRRHRNLRALLRAALPLAQATAAGEAEAAARLAAVVDELRDRFVEHARFEDDVLAPLLQDGDSYGPVRAERLRDGHARRCAELARLCAGGPEDLQLGAAALEQALADALSDLDVEERDFLSPEALRDDPLVVDQATD